MQTIHYLLSLVTALALNTYGASIKPMAVNAVGTNTAYDVPSMAIDAQEPMTALINANAGGTGEHVALQKRKQSFYDNSPLIRMAETLKYSKSTIHQSFISWHDLL